MDLLNSADKKELLEIARRSVSQRGLSEKDLSPEILSNPRLTRESPVFVTLYLSGNLRGCIGHLEPRYPLWEAVARMACESAYHDPRFSPVERHEIDDLEIQISVLTPSEPLENVDDIAIGRDGLIVEQGYRRGVLLPQVAGERNWGPKTFLEQTCRKAGLDTQAWKDPKTEVFRFQALVFGEADLAED